MTRSRIIGYIYVLYPDPVTNHYLDHDVASEDEKELRENERELTAMVPHPDGTLKVIHYVYMGQDIDETAIGLSILLCAGLLV